MGPCSGTLSTGGKLKHNVDPARDTVFYSTKFLSNNVERSPSRWLATSLNFLCDLAYSRPRVRHFLIWIEFAWHVVRHQ